VRDAVSELVVVSSVVSSVVELLVMVFELEPVVLLLVLLRFDELVLPVVLCVDVLPDIVALLSTVVESTVVESTEVLLVMFGSLVIPVWAPLLASTVLSTSTIFGTSGLRLMSVYAMSVWRAA
jgi:hypothetical protein